MKRQSDQSSGTRRLPWLSLVVALLAALGGSITSRAQEDAVESPPIYQRDPYDLITLKKDAEGNGGTFRVRPLDFPDRQIPAAAARQGKLQVEVWHDSAYHKAEIVWPKIEKIDLFEDLVLAEAERLVANGQFDQAYEYYAFLHENHPRWPALGASTLKYLYRNAGALFQQQRYAESLALLDEVRRQDAAYPGLTKALGDVSERLMNGYLQAQRYAAARLLIERTAARSDPQLAAQVAAWKKRLQDEAAARVQGAQAALAAGRYRRAHTEAAQAIEIWPSSTVARDVLAEVSRDYPLIRIAVATPDSLAAAGRLDRARARHQPLLHRPLAELESYGATGGQYGSPLGRWRVGGDLRSMVLGVHREPAAGAAPLTGYDVSRRLWQSAHAPSSPAAHWRLLLQSVEVDNVYQVRVELSTPHLLPLAVVASLPPPAGGDDQPLWQGDYVREVDDGGVIRFVHRSAETIASAVARGPSELVEIPAPDPDLAIIDLREGRLDMIERISPGMVQSLAEEENVRIARYAVPSIHVLTPNYARPLPASAAFRRALAYAIPRAAILRDEILRGADSPGSQPISGPLPRSYAAGQGWGYAYDEDIAPLPYEPRIGVTLIRVAADTLTREAQKNGRPPPQLEELVIGHGNDWLHRRACASIAENLNRAGIRCRCEQIEGDEAALTKCDFVYTELIMTEPAVDLPQWLASDSVRPSAHLALAVRSAVAATNWPHASTRWHQVHETMHAQQTVIPLWQLVDHLAYRETVRGIAEKPVGLYQHVERWRLAPPAEAE